MSVLSFTDITPPARFDNKDWVSVAVEEAPTATGPWTHVEDLDVLPGLDPATPEPQDFTTELALSGYWYRLTFSDADFDETLPYAPVQFLGTEVEFTPSLYDVSAFLRARINNDSSDTFSDDTFPTATHVKRMIAEATKDIRSRVPSIPDSQLGKARWLAALQTARLIELSFFPEQTNEDRSVFANLTDLFNPAMTEFITACRLPMSTTLA